MKYYRKNKMPYQPGNYCLVHFIHKPQIPGVKKLVRKEMQCLYMILFYKKINLIIVTN